MKQVMIKNAENTTKLFRKVIGEIKKHEAILLTEAQFAEEIADSGVMR